MTKNDCPEGPKIAKNTEKSTLENLKNPKNYKKSSFLRDSFFDEKKKAKKAQNKGPFD